ncbi:50S ribosomal protein L29, chloroplastic [Phalaenopsis equestris]|uniref:50S ribosomal protein L29, chloroplastic n=1 Tax=Phalaenopsis equestris TaxID=78828 RepID=UPI0009E2379E|nr:50S ribosomal protein L29, chloroplastic [Phalaenopsis equestris]
MALGLSLPSSHPLYSCPFHPSSSFSNRKAFSLPSLISSFHGIRIHGGAAKALGPPFFRGSGGSFLIRASKREEELKELRGRTTDVLNEEVIDLKGELFMLRLQRSARNEFKSSEFRRMRKRIARMLTIKREREIEEGINKRLSRKLDKKWKRSIVVRPPPSLRKKQEEDQNAAETKKSA